jgi:hypothetical protein
MDSLSLGNLYSLAPALLCIYARSSESRKI